MTNGVVRRSVSWSAPAERSGDGAFERAELPGGQNACRADESGVALRLPPQSIALAALFLVLFISSSAAALTPSEVALREILGEGAPVPIPLWTGQPPRFLTNAPAESVEEPGRIRNVSVPTMSVYLPPKEKRTGMAIIVCAGGGYGGLDWRTHVHYAAKVFVPKGVAVIGLKYRTRPPHLLDNAGIQALTLLDAQRAVRLVRHRAAEWGIDPRRVGVAGYSAGANLTMNLVANFDAGNPKATDAVERLSCRPDFAVGLGTWHWRKPENPFTFPPNAPPVYLVHATTDKPIEIAQSIVADLKKLGVPARLDLFEEGAHGVGNLIPQRVKNGFPPAKWPDLLLEWLATGPKPASSSP